MPDPPPTPTRRHFGGWGASTSSVGIAHRPTDLTDLASIIASPSGRGAIARGLGRSYGDQAACAGGDVVEMAAFDRIGAIDATGRVRVGAGTSIHALLDVAVPAGWFVPVTPGTRQVTVGGAIAADVHGKNHHVDGTFCAHLDELQLLDATGATIVCSPEIRPDVFWATAGGMGLTGIVTEAVIRLIPIETSTMLVDTHRFDHLDEVVAVMADDDPSMPYSVAWIDLLGRRRGRSVLTTGRFAAGHEVDAAHHREPPRARRVPMPPRFPDGLLRPATVSVFNEAWFRASSTRTAEPQSIARFFHPLDGLAAWNRVYGPSGLLQWQIVVPMGAESVLETCMSALAGGRVPCFLAVLKRFGPANPAPMSFPLAGWTLAADMPAATPGLGAVLDRLDHAVAEAGGRVYLAKDGRLDPRLVPRMYPRLDEWRTIREALDPDRIFVSDLARRLGL